MPRAARSEPSARREDRTRRASGRRPRCATSRRRSSSGRSGPSERAPRASPQPLGRELGAVVGGGVQHQLGDALDLPAGRGEPGGRQAQAARDGGAHLPHPPAPSNPTPTPSDTLQRGLELRRRPRRDRRPPRSLQTQVLEDARDRLRPGPAEGTPAARALLGGCLRRGASWSSGLAGGSALPRGGEVGAGRHPESLVLSAALRHHSDKATVRSRRRLETAHRGHRRGRCRFGSAGAARCSSSGSGCSSGRRSESPPMSHRHPASSRPE